MQQVKDILKKFDPLKDRYISREFQAYGIYLAEKLDDYRHKSLYIRLAKYIPRAILEKVLSFVLASNAQKKGALFMWKLKEIGAIEKYLKGKKKKKR